jgi:hypothetical protein
LDSTDPQWIARNWGSCVVKPKRRVKRWFEYRSSEQQLGTLCKKPGDSTAVAWRKVCFRTEITVAVLGNDTLEALPLVEIIPDDKYEFYYGPNTPGATVRNLPGQVAQRLTEKAQDYAKRAHLAWAVVLQPHGHDC